MLISFMVENQIKNREVNMAWPPTPIDMIRELDGASESATTGHLEGGGFFFEAGPGKGLAFYDPSYVQPLIDDHLAEKFNPGLAEGNWAVRLTDKGKQAAEMLRGVRSTSDYRMPDWFLAAVSAV